MKPNKNGFILHYLISGVKKERFYDNHCDHNQLRYEKFLRSIIASDFPAPPPDDIRLGKPGELDLRWEYYYNHANWFVDKSAFYDHLEHIRMDAVTCIRLDSDQSLSAVLWTFGAVDLWLDSKKILTVKEPVYKPIRRIPFTMDVTSGTHRLYIRFQNLGVRDTRNVFGIQLIDPPSGLEIVLPDPGLSEKCVAVADWLDSLSLKKGTLSAKYPAPEAAQVTCIRTSFDADRTVTARLPFMQNTDRVILPEGYEDIYVSVSCCDSCLTRKFNRLDQLLPVFAPSDQPVAYALDDLAASGKLFRPLYNVLARCRGGKILQQDEAEVLYALDLIDSRMDCSDFLLAVLLRLIKTDALSDRLLEKIHPVLLNYRYWMDETGSDGMCFWSENHALTFYGCQMIAGSLYPDDRFLRAKKNGRQMYEEGRARVHRWLCDVRRDGLEEFLSSGYTAVTLGALLNIVDFTDDALAEEAKNVLDQMFLQLAEHTFHGSVIAPQGRVYREVLTPFRTSTQALLYLLDDSLPYEASEWISFMGSTKYKLPYHVRKLFSQPLDKIYYSGNAQIHLYKTGSCLMTSVTSRRDVQHSAWEFIDVESSEAVADFGYVKSLNEKFHGTTRFAPGIFGYQQHLWYCALDNTCFFFANLPGGSCDATSQRPGYWYGNGIMPALWQEKNRLGCIFEITEEHPIPFTHVFFPKMRFDHTLEEEHWLFGVKGDGFAALWCSSPLEPFRDQLEDCEYRACGKSTAYFALCMQRQECKSLESFKRIAKALRPEYNNHTLCTADGFSLTYEACPDTTQYI